VEHPVNNQFEPLEHGEVISVKNSNQVLIGHHTFRVEELAATLKTQLQNAMSDWSADKDDWFTSKGIDCEALRFGSQGWQKGRIRISLEFCADEEQGGGVSSKSVESGSSKSAPAIPATAIELEPIAPIAPPPPPVTVSETPIDIEAKAEDPQVAPATPPAPTLGIAGLGTIALNTTTPTPIEPDRSKAIELPKEEVTLVTDTEAVKGIGTHPSAAANLDEIAFDFDGDDFNLGIPSLEGKMDLELNDLAIDSQEFLDFELTGIGGAHNSEDGGQDSIDTPENSGMLIDEVWSQINQPNWPGLKQS
jgi:hypothetical protein